MALKSQPVLEMTIAGRAAPSSCVVGLALHDGLLYVVCKKSPLVLVYDTNNRCQVGNSLHAAAAAVFVVVFKQGSGRSVFIAGIFWGRGSSPSPQKTYNSPCSESFRPGHAMNHKYVTETFF